LKIFLKESREELVEKSLECAATTCAQMDIDIENRSRKRMKKKMPGEKANDAALTPQQKIKRAMLECIDTFSAELERRLLTMENVFETFAVAFSFAYLLNA
jgi:hypothetical protein